METPSREVLEAFLMLEGNSYFELIKQWVGENQGRGTLALINSQEPDEMFRFQGYVRASQEFLAVAADARHDLERLRSK